MISFQRDSKIAHDLATSAGEFLLQLRADSRWTNESELRRRGDEGSQSLLSKQLQARVPDDAVLSEEAVDDRRRLTTDRVWIIDPLDGTREFAEGREDWAVHVALWQRGKLRAGAVALPARGQTYASHPPPVVPARPSGTPRMVVSRTRPPEEAARVRDALGAELLPMGSAGAKTMAVVRGVADVYIHAGGQFEWDSAAPTAVAQASGLHVSRLDGSPIPYNQPDPWSPELVVCRPELTGVVLEALAS